MFIQPCPHGYTKDDEQYTGPGPFLILIQSPCQGDAMKGVVRSVKLTQFGPWMMGSTTIGGEKITLSGAYGNDGLPSTVSEAIYEKYGLQIPQDLYDAWNKGGGWNSAGSEAEAMRAWANANLKELRRK